MLQIHKRTKLVWGIEEATQRVFSFWNPAFGFIFLFRFFFVFSIYNIFRKKAIVNKIFNSISLYLVFQFHSDVFFSIACRHMWRMDEIKKRSRFSSLHIQFSILFLKKENTQWWRLFQQDKKCISVVITVFLIENSKE